jgi:hypothetical protein
MDLSRNSLIRMWWLASRFWQWPVARGLLLVSTRTRLDGFDVYDASIDGTEAPLGRISEALELIRARAPRRSERLRRDVRRIVVIAAGGPEYWPEADAIVVTRRTLDQSREEVALVIVHEATHARLWAMGIPYIHALRGRIEHTCVRAEVAFAQTLPDAEGWTERLQRKLETPWWTDDALRARRAAAWRELR